MVTLQEILSKKQDILKITEDLGFKDLKIYFSELNKSNILKFVVSVDSSKKESNVLYRAYLEAMLMRLLGCEVKIIVDSQVSNLDKHEIFENVIAFNDENEKELLKKIDIEFVKYEEEIDPEVITGAEETIAYIQSKNEEDVPAFEPDTSSFFKGGWRNQVSNYRYVVLPAPEKNREEEPKEIREDVVQLVKTTSISMILSVIKMDIQNRKNMLANAKPELIADIDRLAKKYESALLTSNEDVLEAPSTSLSR